MNQDFAESVARFRAELASAVTRSKRAAADARSHSADVRREVEQAAEPQSEPKPVPPSDPDDEDFSEQTILFRP